MSNSSVAPFVKWAGGKRQLLPQIRERMPKSALINDINGALINAYKQICHAPEVFLVEVGKFDAEMFGKETDALGKE